MNYTYIPQADGLPYEAEPCIILTTPTDTVKFHNILSNSNVSLLVHDWVTSKPMDKLDTTNTARRPSLAQMLKDMNQNELSSISATLAGTATVLEGDSAKFFREKHHQANPGDAKYFINDSTAVIMVKIQSATVADCENHVKVYDSL